MVVFFLMVLVLELIGDFFFINVSIFCSDVRSKKNYFFFINVYVCVWVFDQI